MPLKESGNLVSFSCRYDKTRQLAFFEQLSTGEHVDG